MKKNDMYSQFKKLVNEKISNALYCYKEYDSDYDYLIQEMDEIIGKRMTAINSDHFSIRFEYGRRNTRITLMTDDVIGTTVFTNSEYDMLLRKLEKTYKDFQREIREIRKEKHKAFKQQSKRIKKNECLMPI